MKCKLKKVICFVLIFVLIFIENGILSKANEGDRPIGLKLILRNEAGEDLLKQTIDEDIQYTADLPKGQKAEFQIEKEGNCQYQFSREISGESEEIEILQEFSEKTEYVVENLQPGTYLYYIEMRSESGDIMSEKVALEVKEEDNEINNDNINSLESTNTEGIAQQFTTRANSSDLDGTLTSNRGNSVYTNRTVILTAQGINGGGTYEYKFSQVAKNGEVMLRDWNSNGRHSFQTKESGDYIYAVDIRDSSGTIVRKTISLRVNPEPLVELEGELEISKNQSYMDRTVILTATATKGNGNYNYEFLREFDGKTEVVQNSGNGIYSFQTNMIGDFKYYVIISDRVGKEIKKSVNLRVTTHPDDKLDGVLICNRTGSVYTNRTIILDAMATNGYGNYTYEFVQTHNGITKVVREYNSSGKYSFVTNLAGQFVYGVNIKDRSGAVIRKTFNLKVNPEPGRTMSVSLESNKGTQVYMDRTVSLKANAMGGSGNYQYKFEKMHDGKMETIQDYSEKNTYSFVTSEVGSYTYYVTVKDATGTLVEKSATFTVKAHPDNKLAAALSASHSGSVFTNRTFSLTANVTKGYGDYQYQFSRKYNGITKVVREYSSNNRYSVQTDLAGVYTYYVDVKDRSGTTIKLSYVITVKNETLHGIDVSHHNGDVDWVKVKKQNISFAMIRAGYGWTGQDRQFEKNYTEAKKQGIKIGIYHYSYATNVFEAKKEAENLLKILDGRNVQFPVAYDLEDILQRNLSKETLTAIAVTFCDTIKAAGYTPMIYSSTSWYNSKFDLSKLTGYKIWVAHWGISQKPSIGLPVSMWQYTSTANIPGANTDTGCDANYSYGLY